MALAKGSDGFAVANLQKNLIQIGLMPLKPDGVFGLDTEEAVKRFQESHALPQTGVVDQTTQDAVVKSLVGQIIVPDAAPWMTWMKAHIGQVEKTKSKATKFDDEVFSHTSYGRLDGIMEPGCAATACAALEESGLLSPHNASAESFRSFGVACEIKPGAIVGFNWKGKKGVHCDHVSFVDHLIGDHSVACLGGNQGHQVKVSVFLTQFIDFVRWPKEEIKLSDKIISVKAV